MLGIHLSCRGRPVCGELVSQEPQRQAIGEGAGQSELVEHAAGFRRAVLGVRLSPEDTHLGFAGSGEADEVLQSAVHPYHPPFVDGL